MKDSRGVYVGKHSVRDDHLSRNYQFYTSRVIRDHRYEVSTREASVQYDYRRDNVICTCRTPGLRRQQELRYFSGIPKQVYAYHGPRSFTDIGVGSVKALQKKKVKRIYLPETDDRGVGSSDLSSFISRRTRYYRSSYYEHKRTSSKCVGGLNECNTELLNEKLSPIVHTRSGTTSPSVPLTDDLQKNEIGSNTHEKNLATISTQVEDDIQKEGSKNSKVTEHSVAAVKVASKAVKSQEVVPVIEGKRISKRAQEAERVFSSDSLVQHVHNLEHPSQDKQSPMSIDPMENKLEREYRKMFCTKSKESKEQKASEEKTDFEMKSTSVLRRRFEALRRGLAKKEDSKRNAVLAARDSSNVSSLNHRDVSIASDPPSLEGRSYSNTKIYSPFQNMKMENDISRSLYKKPIIDRKDLSKPNEVDSEYQSVRGMFKLWGKKFNLEDEECSPGPSVDISKKTKDSKIPPTESESKKEGKKFFFFKKKSKDKTKQPFKQKKGVTAGRCEVGDGLMIKIGAASPQQPIEKHEKKEVKVVDVIPEDYEEMLRKAWLQQFLAQTIESRNSVKIRWNNNAYATSSSTVFEIMENVYKDTGVVFRSKSEVTTGESSYYKSFTKQKVNFVQDIEAWMIPKYIPDRVKVAPCRIHSDEKGDTNNNIEVTISDNKWFIDKSKAFAHKIEVVLHSNTVVKANKDSSSEYLRIDIPKGFFSNSSTDSSSQMQTSNEEVYKIVEYETPESNSALRKNIQLDKGDQVVKDIKVTVSFKDSGDVESKILETVIKRPAVQRDVVIQGSNVYVPKRCNVIGVGIITQKDITKIGKPIFKLQDEYTDDESDPPLVKNQKQNTSKFAESYLHDYYRNWTPLGMDFYSWCVSDSHLKSCSEYSHTTVNPHGDGSKSCPNILDDYQTSAIVSSCGTSCCSQCAPWLEETKEDTKITKIFKKIKSYTTKKTEFPPGEKRAFPKDSFAVFRRRMHNNKSSNKGKWACLPNDMPFSVPSIQSTGAQGTDDPKCAKPACNKPQKKKKPCKRVSLPVEDQPIPDPCCRKFPPAGILSFKSTSKCDLCNKVGKVACPKHAKIIPQASCEIPPPRMPCKDPPPPPPPCYKSIPPCPKSPPPCPSSPCPKSAPPCPSSPQRRKSPPRCPPSPPRCPPSPPRCPPSPPPCPPSPPSCKSPSPCASTTGTSSGSTCSSPSPCPSPPVCGSRQSFQLVACVSSHLSTKRCCQGNPPPCKRDQPACTPVMSGRKMPKPCTPSPPRCCSKPECGKSSPSQTCPSSPKSPCYPPCCPPKPPCPKAKKKKKKKICPLKLSPLSSPRPKKDSPTCLPPPCPAKVSPPCAPQPCPAKVSPPCIPKPCPAASCPCPPARPPSPPCPPPPKCPSPPASPPCPPKPCPPKPCSPPASPPCPPKPCPPASPPCVKPKPCPPPPCPPSPPKCPPKPCPPSPPKCPPKPCPPSPPKCPPKPCPPSPPKCPPKPCPPSPPKCPPKPCPPSPPKCPPKPCPPSPPKSPPKPCPPSPPKCPPKPCPPSPPKSCPPSPPKCPPKPSPPCPPPSRVNPCPTQPCKTKKKPIPCNTPPCKVEPPKKCKSQEYPWPTRNQVSNQPSLECLTPDRDGKCKKNCSFLPECAKPRKPKPCCSKPKISGIFLKMNPAKKTCSKECTSWSAPKCSDRSEDDYFLNVKQGTPSTEEIREGMHIRVQDEDGQTLYERIDYERQRPSVLNDMFETNVQTVSTSIVQNMVQESKSIANAELDEAKSDSSVANLIEINFKLKVTQGDKTTEFNVGQDGVVEKPKTHTKNQFGQTSQEVFLLKDEAEQCTEETNDKNDINIKIIIKNFKPKKKKEGGRRYSVDVEDFNRKISEKFHTVSTGYSNIERHNINRDCETHNLQTESDEKFEKIHNKENTGEVVQEDDVKHVYSVHRATINLASSNEVSRTQMSNEAVSEDEYVSREPIDLMTYSRSATDADKSATERTESKTEDVQSRKESDLEEKFSNGKEVTYYSTSDVEDLELMDANTMFEEPVSEANNTDLIPTSLTKDEKKQLLKKIFEKACKSKKMKNKSRMKQLRDMLKIILTSDSSDHEENPTSNELIKEMTYASLKPNLFRDTDSMNNYYVSSVISSANNVKQNMKYPTQNDSQCSVVSDSSDENMKVNQGCLCSTLAARLKMCEKDVNGVCCCKKPVAKKIDEETCCDLRTEEDFFLLNYKSIEYTDVETQNSKFVCNSTNISIHRKAISSSIRNNDYPNLEEISDRNKEVACMRVKRTFSPHANHIKPCDMKRLNRNTMLGISDEDKVYMLDAKPTNVSIGKTSKKAGKSSKERDKNRKKKSIFDKPADILQCYETKKAVLEIYTEKTVSNEEERLVAKLPKFVCDKESEIERNYGEYAQSSYMALRSNVVMMSVNR